VVGDGIIVPPAVVELVPLWFVVNADVTFTVTGVKLAITVQLLVEGERRPVVKVLPTSVPPQVPVTELEL